MDKLKIRVDYYDNKQKELFDKNPSATEIQKIAGSIIEIPKSEFLTYMIFTEKEDNKPTFKTYSDIKNKIRNRIAMFEEYINFSDGGIKSNFTNKQFYDDITERIGVAGSLCLVNQIHNLTEADWQRIPEGFEKTLDFKISDGIKFIYVESKGSILENNKKKEATISNHKAHIESKKVVQRDNKKNTADIFYGVISVIDNQHNETLQCWLVDPDAPLSNISPTKFRILSRLYFYWINLGIISQRSAIQLALINRIKAIELSDNLEAFNKLPLMNARGKSIRLYSTSFLTKSVIERENIIGCLYPFKKDKLIFIGFHTYIYRLLVSQNFTEIINYKFFNGTEIRTITCRIKKSDIRYLQISEQLLKEYMHSDKELIEFKVENQFYYSNSGRVFGIIDLNETMNKNEQLSIF
jgi:hypothetical protein